MKQILNRCTHGDFQAISDMLNSRIHFRRNKKRRLLLEEVETNPKVRGELVDLLDQQIRYFGSSDIGYLKRSILNSDGGVSADDLLQDISKKLRTPVKIGKFESQVESLVRAVVEKELSEKSPIEIREYFKKAGVGVAQTDLIEKRIKRDGTAAALPILFEVLGPKVVLSIIEPIAVGVISSFIGRAAAKQVVREIIKRNPWANALGPVIWTASACWLAYDIQGPAYRKTIPVMLYLGIIALRDGAEPETKTRDAVPKSPAIRRRRPRK